jgi:hypothetical protein
MDTDGLKALQTLGDASHFFIFLPLRKEIPQRMKYTARSADAWCASALSPAGRTRPFDSEFGGLLGPFSCTFSYQTGY